MLIEFIYRGLSKDVQTEFLKELLTEAREVYFNFPKVNATILSYSDVVKVIDSENYVDLVINTDYLHINSKVVPKVFINFGQSDENVELLYFFNSDDLGCLNNKAAIEYLNGWADNFFKTYRFNYFICQMDGADEDEYYFDSLGKGKLYSFLR